MRTINYEKVDFTLGTYLTYHCCFADFLLFPYLAFPRKSKVLFTQDLF